MPRVPTAGTTTGGVAFTPQANPQQIVGVAQAIGKGAEQVAGIAMDAQMRLDEAARKQRSAVADSEVATELGALQIAAQNDPNFTGSANRFKEQAAAMLGELGDRFDKNTAASAFATGTRLAGSLEVSVRAAETARLGENARSTMNTLTDNYITAAASAPDKVSEDEVTTNFFKALSDSDFLRPTEKAVLAEKFATGVSSAQALGMLQSDPEALLDIIDDPSVFPRLSEESRVRFANQALISADRANTERDRLAAKSVTARQELTLGDTMARFIEGGDGNSSEEIRADVLLNRSDYSTSGLKVIESRLREASRGGGVTDDRQTVVNIDDDIRSGERDVRTTIDDAYIAGTITSGTRDSRLRMLATRSEPKSSPFRAGLEHISDALGPGFMDSLANKSQAETRRSNAAAEFEAFNAAGNRTSEALRQKSRDIVTAYSGEIDTFAVTRAPYGVDVSKGEVSSADLSKSDKAIARAMKSGSLTEDEAILLFNNNNALKQAVRSIEANNAKAAK